MSLVHLTTSETIEQARRQLGEFVVEQAEKASELGFGWQPHTEAPSTYPDLCAAFRNSQSKHVPLLVSSLHNDAVITTPEANLAMRFWHDVNHVQRGLTLNGVDEQELALWHLDVLEAHGFPEYSLVWQMLWADTVGQNLLLGICDSFPLDQHRFVLGCIEEGFDRGLLREARLIEAGAQSESGYVP
jgi:hypothetical protein